MVCVQACWEDLDFFAEAGWEARAEKGSVRKGPGSWQQENGGDGNGMSYYCMSEFPIALCLLTSFTKIYYNSISHISKLC
jgi:hypothetical protein